MEGLGAVAVQSEDVVVLGLAIPLRTACSHLKRKHGSRQDDALGQIGEECTAVGGPVDPQHATAVRIVNESDGIGFGDVLVVFARRGVAFGERLAGKQTDLARRTVQLRRKKHRGFHVVFKAGLERGDGLPDQICRNTY